MLVGKKENAKKFWLFHMPATQPFHVCLGRFGMAFSLEAWLFEGRMNRRSASSVRRFTTQMNVTLEEELVPVKSLLCLECHVALF